jgi:hypothetical protein
MGEVYRADDLKLGQPVALKFLPQTVHRDQARLERFLNEVRTALKVSHPNVCRVHDIGEVDGQHYLSMEYVCGSRHVPTMGYRVAFSATGRGTGRLESLSPKRSGLRKSRDCCESYSPCSWVEPQCSSP